MGNEEELLAEVLDILGLNQPEVREVDIKVWFENDVVVMRATHDAAEDAYDLNIRSQKYPSGYTY